MHSVNSRVCKAVDGLALLESSLPICDAQHIVLLAFRVPRERNLLHLSPFTGWRLPDALRPRKRMLLPELPQERSDPKPSQLSQPPPSSLFTALSKFSTQQSTIASTKSARAKTRQARRYSAFAESVGLQAFPASEQSVALFLIHFVLATWGCVKSLSSQS